MPRWSIERSWAAGPAPGSDRDAAFAFELAAEGFPNRRITVEYAAPSTMASKRHAMEAMHRYLGDDEPPRRLLVSRNGDAHPIGQRWSVELRTEKILTVSPEEAADSPRSIARLIFAAQDMDECSAAAEFLLARDDLSRNVQRALETAVSVAYARPWGQSNTIGRLGDHWLPLSPQERFLHDDVIGIRHKVYAHTDEEIAARGMEDVSAIAEVPGPYFVPAWHPLNPQLLRPIAELAKRQKARFVGAVHELQERLRSTEG